MGTNQTGTVGWSVADLIIYYGQLLYSIICALKLFLNRLLLILTIFIFSFMHRYSFQSCFITMHVIVSLFKFTPNYCTVK